MKCVVEGNGGGTPALDLVLTLNGMGSEKSTRYGGRWIPLLISMV